MTVMRKRGERARGSARAWFRRRRAVVEGVARVDRRTKDLLHRIRQGEIAIILHDDLDQVSAEGLVERGAAAVVNLHRSITGRYPNAGPLVLARARVPLIDAVGEGLLERVSDGDRIRIEGADIFSGEQRIGGGTLLDAESVEEHLAQAHGAIGDAIEDFVRNTMEYLNAERDLILHGRGEPALRTPVKGRPVVVVIRGVEYKQDLRALRGYIADLKPVLVAVDGGADALIEEGHTPHIIVGDMDSVSTDALTSGAEIVVHAYPDGTAPGLERVQALGIEAHVLASGGTSEDIALLLAYDHGADLIVAVGAHDNLVEFLDKGRGGMASTFLVRLKVGPKLVDVKGVNRLYRAQVRTRDVVLLVGGAVTAMAVAAYIVPGPRLWVRGIVDFFQDLIRGIGG